MSQKEQFDRDGILVVERFLDEKDVDGLREACDKLVHDMDPDVHRGVFSATTQAHAKINDRYFLDSNDKIRYFFETDAFDENGKLQLPKDSCLNKIGHALHWIDPLFKKVSFSDKVKTVARSLDLKDPVLVQGMYIFKQPKVGGEGYWFPIDDATLENGCLWYVPGSHKKPVTRRFLRTGQVGTKDLLEFRGEDKVWPADAWKAAPVKKGSLVLIHGQVAHKSERNLSSSSRHAYTFHIIEMEGSFYASKNWLQPPLGGELPKLYREEEACVQETSQLK